MYRLSIRRLWKEIIKRAMRVYVKRFFSVLLLVAGISLLLAHGFLNKNAKVFLCQETSEGYELILYNKKNKEVFSSMYPCEPWVENIANDIWEIGVSTGNPSRFVFYFDRKNTKISETFFNPILVDNMYIAYMEGNNLILMDIFREGILYEEISRDYSKMADPISAIDSIEVLENGDIKLQYYEGEDIELVLEIIQF